jgi:hypothetical protein
LPCENDRRRFDYADDDRPRRRRDDEDDDRPRRDDRDDYDDRPRRRGDGAAAGAGVSVALVVGIILGVLLVGGVAVLLLFMGVQRVRVSAARLKDQNNLKQIAIAMHSYHESNGVLPPAGGDVSWRVHLLPYVEQSRVYQQFDLNQPWDSPANKRLASQTIPTYVAAGDMESAPETHYRVFVGPHTLYEPGKVPLNFAGVTDGLGSTLFAVEATDAVPWPAPKELEYDRNGPLPPLGLPNRKGFNVTMLDGSVRFVTDKTSEDSIRAGIDPKDKKLFNPEGRRGGAGECGIGRPACGPKGRAPSAQASGLGSRRL